VAFAGPPAIAVRRASCDKGGGEILDGGGVDTDFGAADLLDVWGGKYFVRRGRIAE